MDPRVKPEGDKEVGAKATHDLAPRSQSVWLCQSVSLA